MLKALGAIKTCVTAEGQFVSTYFLVPKSDGSFRFILNLKKLNDFIHTDHFKLEDIRTAIKLSSGDFMAKLDLQNAYFLVPIAEGSRKLLRFIFKDQLYEFNCLPFDLSTAPYIFTKIMKPW